MMLASWPLASASRLRMPSAAVIEGAVSWPMTRVATSAERNAQKQLSAQIRTTASAAQRPRKSSCSNAET